MKKIALALAGLSFLVLSPIAAFADDNTVSVTGEILDMACYTDHGAHGDGHAACAQHCIASGLPVGIKSASDGKVYIVIGAHKPMNDVLAPLAAKTVTLKGKAVTRDGVNLLENAEIVP
jgi:type 1 fimbria pilin